MADPLPATAPRLAATLLLALLAACTSQEQLRRAELLSLAELLPGSYDNREQAAGDRAGNGPLLHLPEQLEITRVSAPVLGKAVFHVREHAAGDDRRVLSDRLWVFDSLEGSQLVAQVARFAEPARWAGERAAPELLRSILPQDVQMLPGCTLRWSVQATGASAVTAAPGCATALPGSGIASGAAGAPGAGGQPGGAARIAQQWRLAGEQLEFAEYPAGQAPADADWLRFLRQAGP